MLLKYFSSNKAGLLVLFLFLALFFWLKTLLNPAGLIADSTGLAGPLGRWLIKPLSAVPFVSSLLAFVAVLLFGYLLVLVNAKYLFLKSKSQLPLFFFIIIAGGLVSMRFLSPALLSLMLVIIVLFRLLNSFKKDRLTYHFLDGGILMGIAVLIYVPALIVFPLLYIVLFLFRNKVWQEWIYPCIGFSLPFLFWTSFLFLTDQSLLSIGEEFRRIFSYTGNMKVYTLMQLILYGYLSILSLIGSLHMIRTIGNRKIQSRLFFMVFLWFFILSLLMLWAFPAAGSDFLYFGGISIAFLLSNYFITCRITRFNDLMLVLLLAGIILTIADDWFSIIPGRFIF
jgi:hypothetical protein